MLFKAEEIPLKSRPIVYVTQETSYNLLPASRYGRLEIMWSGKCTSTADYAAATLNMRLCLKGFNEESFILLVGDPVLIGIAFSEAVRVAAGKPVNVLQWDRDLHEYNAISILTT